MNFHIWADAICIHQVIWPESGGGEEDGQHVFRMLDSESVFEHPSQEVALELPSTRDSLDSINESAGSKQRLNREVTDMG